MNASLIICTAQLLAFAPTATTTPTGEAPPAIPPASDLPSRADADHGVPNAIDRARQSLADDDQGRGEGTPFQQTSETPETPAVADEAGAATESAQLQEQARRQTPNGIPPNHTRVHFEVSGKRNYTVRIAGTELSCQAPCDLAVPESGAEFVFQMGKNHFRKSLTLAGNELRLELVRPTSPGKLIAGGILTGLGATSLALGVFWTVLAISVYNSIDSAVENTAAGKLFTATSRSVLTVYAAIFAAIGYAIGIATLTPGIILVQRGKGSLRVEPVKRLRTEADSPLDSLRFAVVPISDGALAGVGFRF